MKLFSAMHYFKNKFSEIIILSFLFIVFYSCSDTSEITVSEILVKKEIKNVSYGADSDQKYDIYLPEGRSAVTKTFMVIHGGGWISGDKDDMSAIVSMLQLNFPNYTIVNINYRLAGINNPPFPMQTDDIESVISHLKSEASSYQIGEELAFIGTSAGAHLSMLYAYKYNNSSNIKMVCSIVGPTNFTDSNYMNNAEYSNFRLAMQLITGYDFNTNSEYYEALSPYHIVTESAPPTLLFYGGKDELIPTSQGIDMNEKLNQLEVEHEFNLYENEGHGWNGENLIDTTNKLIAFINKHF